MSKDNREELLQVGAFKPHCLKCGKQLNETIGNICPCCAREVTTDSGADVCEWETDVNNEYVHIRKTSCGNIYQVFKDKHQGIEGFKVCPYCTKPITIKGEEMLESLIELYKFYESLSWRSPYVDHEKIKNTIEKATGKSWSEIKELLV